MQPNNPYYPPGPSAPQGPMPGQMPQPMQPGVPTNIPPQQPSGKNSTGLIVGLVLTSVLLLGALGFGFWAYSERQDYKNNSDQKVAAAVEVVKEQTTEENVKQFAEESKNPLKPFTGPSAYGTVKVLYPKTWSAYANSMGGEALPLHLAFHPDVVPALSEEEGRQAIALQIEVRNEAYDAVLSERQGELEEGNIKATSYELPKMKGEVGVKFVGKINEKFNGTQIIIPLRDKTLIITSETDQFMTDVNKYILPNITFVP